MEIWSTGGDADLADVLTRADQAVDDCPPTLESFGLEAEVAPVDYPDQADAHAAVRLDSEIAPGNRQEIVADGTYVVQVTALEPDETIDVPTVAGVVDTVLDGLREAEPLPRP